MAKIPSFQKTRLRFGAHFAVMSAFDERVAPLAQQEPLLTAAYNTFKAALDDEDAAVKIARSSDYSPQILSMDNIRDRLYSNAKLTGEMWEELGIEPQATAARAIMHEVRLYKLDTRAQYDQETGLMMNFLQPFETETMQAHLTTLGLTAVFTQMKAANEEVRRLLALRDDERAEKSAYDLKQSRQATDAAYDVLVDRINALATLDDQHTYDTFIAQWSAEIARIKQQILSQSNSSGSGSGSGSGSQGQGGSGGGQEGSGSGGQQSGGGGEEPGTGGGDDPGTGGETPVTPDPGTGGGGDGPDFGDQE